MLYKAVGPFLDPETKIKINFSTTRTHDDLSAMYHPSQLEKRFGGEADTPTNYWPPYIGAYFIPKADKESMKKEFSIKEGEDY
jgi:hypothetical protein